MCHFVSYIMYVQKIIVYKTPPAGEGGLLPAQGLAVTSVFNYFLFKITKQN